VPRGAGLVPVGFTVGNGDGVPSDGACGWLKTGGGTVSAGAAGTGAEGYTGGKLGVGMIAPGGGGPMLLSQTRGGLLYLLMQPTKEHKAKPANIRISHTLVKVNTSMWVSSLQ